jgi:hypothetical protein
LRMRRMISLERVFLKMFIDLLSVPYRTYRKFYVASVQKKCKVVVSQQGA